MAKPSIRYSTEVSAEICSRLMAGEALTRICQDDHMPSKTAVFSWLETNAAFQDQYAFARQVQADTIFDEILEIADDARNDWMAVSAEKGGGFAVNHENIQRSRLRIDARKWMAAKLAPKKFGDRQILDHAGGLSLTVVTGVPRAECGEDLV